VIRSGEEIAKALTAFAKKWGSFDGTEKAASQTFLNQLVECYSGTKDVFEVGATFEEFGPTDEGSGYMDLYWPDIVIIEMKRPSEGARLEFHRYQVIDYWRNSSDVATGKAAPRFLVLCSFNRFEVWEPGRYPKDPVVTFSLEELPDRYEELLFLASEEPLFLGPRRELTIAAANDMVQLYQRLEERAAGEQTILHTFVLRAVWCLFAEDLGLLPGHPVQRIVDLRTRDANRAASDLVHLFEALDKHPGPGRDPLFFEQPYVDGQLFAESSHVYLDAEELELLGSATEHDWRQVDPTIFGSLLEGFLGPERRSETGIHYTHEADIMKIVRPTVVEPWTERLAAVTTPAEGEAVLHNMSNYRVLDPACGCGNFLYLAYRELRAIEHELRLRIAELYTTGGATPPPSTTPPYALSNLYGIEIEEFAVAITRVVLWMGQKLAADRYDTHETVLPLVSLSNIVQGDALKFAWPEVDAIIGNPPFNGSQHLRKALGDEYVEWLKKEFNCGVKDYCVYWFRNRRRPATRDAGRARRDELDLPEQGPFRQPRVRR